MSKFFTPFKVGLLALVGGAALYYSFSEVRKDRTGGYMVYAYINDAAELAVNSAVKVAGINVGEIKDISLATESELQKAGVTPNAASKDKMKKGVAKVAIRIDEDVDLFHDCTIDNLELKGAIASKTTSSLLGTYYIELSPGSDKCPKLVHGDVIPNIYQDPTIGQLSAQVNDILPDMKAIAVNMREISESVRDAIASDRGKAEMKEMMDNLNHIVAKVDETVDKETVVLARIMDNVDSITQDAKTITKVGGENLKDSLENIKVVTNDIRSLTHDEATGGPSETIADTSSLLDNANEAAKGANKTFANTAVTTETLNNGKGTIPTLLNDEEMGASVKETVEGAGEFIDSLTRMRVLMTFGSEYNGDHPETDFRGSGFRSYIGIRLQPKPDKFYELELTDDPRSFNSFKITEEKDLATGQVVVTETHEESDAFKFSFQMGLSWRFLTLRYGLRDNTGAIGLDLKGNLFCRYGNICQPVELKSDLFDFAAPFFQLDTPRYPRVRLTAITPIPTWRGFYMVAGLDDILNAPALGLEQHQRTWFLGLQYRFDDQDLKALLSVMPSFSF